MVQVVLENGCMKVRGEMLRVQLILDCGQAFRYTQQKDGSYFGVAGQRAIYMRDAGEGIEVYPVCRQEEQEFWENYLDLHLDYTQILAKMAEKDQILAKAAREFPGIRLLNQQPFETLISFIISANNHIPRIKGILERLCTLAGERKNLEGREYFAFPAPERLAALREEDLRAIGAGYRAPYLLQTARRICDGFSLDALRALSYGEAKAALCTLPGVGPKVADCVLLFSLGKKEAFPADTWIHKVIERLYGVTCTTARQSEAFARRQFGTYGGIAQQYLFHYARMHRLT